jgi:hypothetical protein
MPENIQENVTDEQLHRLAVMLRPGISRVLGEPEADVAVRISFVAATSERPSALRVEVRVRGEDIPPEKDAKVIEFIRTSSPTV